MGTFRQRSRVRRRGSALYVLMVLLAFHVSGCAEDGDEFTANPRVQVVFDYFAATEADPAAEEAAPNCVQNTINTHCHPSWEKWFRFKMEAVADDHWQITFDQVPTGTLQKIRISDPNRCGRFPCGVVTTNVYANGVELTRQVDTPGGCSFTNTSLFLEPGFAFTVSEDGTVTP